MEYYRDEPFPNHAAVTESKLFKSKVRKTRSTLNNGNTKDSAIAVP